MAYIYEYIKHFYPNNINEGLFYDLGSGTGKAVLAMSLMHKFKKCIGIEYLDNLIQLSQGIKQNYNKNINNIFKIISNYLVLNHRYHYLLLNILVLL